MTAPTAPSAGNLPERSESGVGSAESKTETRPGEQMKDKRDERKPQDDEDEEQPKPEAPKPLGGESDPGHVDVPGKGP